MFGSDVFAEESRLALYHYLFMRCVVNTTMMACGLRSFGRVVSV